MNKTIFAILFSLILLSGCNNSEPIMVEENTGDNEMFSTSIRSVEEVIALAQKAYGTYFSADDATRAADDSQSIPPIATVNAVKNLSRGVAGRSDTLYYVVNFADDRGFAVIAADKRCTDILGISDCGNLAPQGCNENPGMEIFLERVPLYIEDVISSGESDIIKNSSSITPAIDIPLTQYKEYDDTVFEVNIDRRVAVMWRQGISAYRRIEEYPEGYLFENGLCGCGPLAIAQGLTYFGYPDTLYSKSVEKFEVEWRLVKRHRRIQKGGIPAKCEGTETAQHMSVANVCRVIGDLGEVVVNSATSGTTASTSMSMNKVPDVLAKLGYVRTELLPFNSLAKLSSKEEIYLLSGTDENVGGHAWIMDGEKCYTCYHHYAYKEEGKPWVDTITYTTTGDILHFNWGWGGDGDGWYIRGLFVPSNATHLKYDEVKCISMRRT